MSDTDAPAPAGAAQSPMLVDPQDPLPESSWFWRRLIVSVGLGLCAIGEAGILAVIAHIGTKALSYRDAANGAQIALQSIDALHSLGFWLVIVILVNLALYLIAPSAEQATKMLATVSAWKNGVSTAVASRVALPGGTAASSTVAGPAAPEAAAAPAPAAPAAPAAPVAPAEPVEVAPAAPAPAAAAPPAPAAPAAPAASPEASAAPVEPVHVMAMAAAPVAPLSPAIEMVSVDMLRVACPSTPIETLAPWVAPIKDACHRFEIDKIRRVAAFVAQMAVESAGFTRLEENLRYSAKRLTEVWPRRFPTLDAAKPYAANPQKLANKVYAGRMGNGDEASGDGWTFRGGGPLQVTGRDNWTAFAKAMGLSVDAALAYGRTVAGGVMAAAWFWESNDLNRLADTPGVADESRRINGGDNGLADRKAKFDALIAWMLKHQPAAQAGAGQ